MNADGNGGRVLYNGPSEEWGATFSPDGTKVVFTVDQPNGTAAIFMIDVAGGEPWRVSERGSYPSWVPAAGAFVPSVDPGQLSAATQSGSRALTSAPLSLPGDDLMRLTFGGTRHYTAAFAPDQSRILLSVEMDDGWQIFEADPNGGGLTRQITDGPYNHYQTDYSRDGRTFLTSVNFDGDGDIYLFDASTGEPLEQLTDNPGLDYQPRFLPDESGYIYSSDTDGDHEVYLMIFGGRQTKLTDNSTFDGFAEISPDGQWITFYSGRDDDYEIYVMDIQGRNPRRLTYSGGRDASPSFTP
ncbi:MAG TPA: hypothetical protein PLR07_15210, partial [Promineifilum sp.]|nr:hypothetical protein [Promineifilum sp.]